MKLLERTLTYLTKLEIFQIETGKYMIVWPKPPTEMTIVKLSYINLS
jgi:hypothetical protein